MAAIEQECPSSHHKLCLFHMDQNLAKHGKGLGEGVLAAVLRKFHDAAYGQTEEVGNRDANVTCFCRMRESTQERWGCRVRRLVDGLGEMGRLHSGAGTYSVCRRLRFPCSLLKPFPHRECSVRSAPLPISSPPPRLLRVIPDVADVPPAQRGPLQTVAPGQPHVHVHGGTRFCPTVSTVWHGSSGVWDAYTVISRELPRGRLFSRFMLGSYC